MSALFHHAARGDNRCHLCRGRNADVGAEPETPSRAGHRSAATGPSDAGAPAEPSDFRSLLWASHRCRRQSATARSTRPARGFAIPTSQRPEEFRFDRVPANRSSSPPRGRYGWPRREGRPTASNPATVPSWRGDPDPGPVPVRQTEASLQWQGKSARAVLNDRDGIGPSYTTEGLTGQSTMKRRFLQICAGAAIGQAQTGGTPPVVNRR